MSKFWTSALALIGIATAATSTTGCVWLFYIDEPEMPKSLIER